jgi:hypothetical protein
MGLLLQTRTTNKNRFVIYEPSGRRKSPTYFMLLIRLCLCASALLPVNLMMR